MQWQSSDTDVFPAAFKCGASPKCAKCTEDGSRFLPFLRWMVRRYSCLPEESMRIQRTLKSGYRHELR